MLFVIHTNISIFNIWFLLYEINIVLGTCFISHIGFFTAGDRKVDGP